MKRWAKIKNISGEILLIILINLIIIAVLDRLIGWIFKAPVEGRSVYHERSIRLRQFESNLDIMQYPSDYYMSNTDGLERKAVKFRTDELGFLKPSKKHEQPDINIFFIGGSTTECQYVEESKRFPVVAGNLIEEETGFKVNSYNGGRSGNNTLHSIDILLNRILPLKPDMVLMMHNVNDLIILLYAGTYWNEHFNRSPVVDQEIVLDRQPTLFSLSKRIFRFITPHLHFQTKNLFYRTKAAFGTAPEAVDEWAGIRRGKLKYSKEWMVSEFKKMLRTFVAVCKIHNVTPVLMTQQNRYTENPDQLIQRIMKQMNDDFGIEYNEFRTIYNEFTESIRAIAKEENILLIDLDVEIPRNKEFIYDTFHLNDKGSLLAAKVISSGIIKQIFEIYEKKKNSN
jgi:lysophospholipase L1-like esterase